MPTTYIQYLPWVESCRCPGNLKKKRKKRKKEGPKSLVHNYNMQKALNTRSSFLTQIVAKLDPNSPPTKTCIPLCVNISIIQCRISNVFD